MEKRLSNHDIATFFQALDIKVYLSDPRRNFNPESVFIQSGQEQPVATMLAKRRAGVYIYNTGNYNVPKDRDHWLTVSKTTTTRPLLVYDSLSGTDTPTRVHQNVQRDDWSCGYYSVFYALQLIFSSKIFAKRLPANWIRFVRQVVDIAHTFTVKPMTPGLGPFRFHLKCYFRRVSLRYYTGKWFNDILLEVPFYFKGYSFPDRFKRIIDISGRSLDINDMFEHIISPVKRTYLNMLTPPVAIPVVGSVSSSSVRNKKRKKGSSSVDVAPSLKKKQKHTRVPR